MKKFLQSTSTAMNLSETENQYKVELENDGSLQFPQHSNTTFVISIISICIYILYAKYGRFHSILKIFHIIPFLASTIFHYSSWHWGSQSEGLFYTDTYFSPEKTFNSAKN